MTDNTDNQVVGWITYYDRDKQFGFAQRLGGIERIFFYQSGCREVEGTPEEPILTNRPSNQQPRWRRGTKRIERIVLRVVQGPKGPKAVVWGFVPVRTWLEELHHFGDLQRYDSGTVSIIYSRDYGGYGHIAQTERGQLTAAPRLESGDPWVLTLEYQEEDHIGAILGSPPKERKTVVFQLDEAYPSKRRSYGRCGMDVWVGPDGPEAWAHIVFTPPDD